jgi:hypothetical protein
MVVEMLHVRWNNLTGKYDSAPARAAKPLPGRGPQA